MSKGSSKISSVSLITLNDTNGDELKDEIFYKRIRRLLRVDFLNDLKCTILADFWIKNILILK